MRRLLTRLFSQERAIANAREASTHLSRALVEREDVAIYLQDLASRRRGERSA